MYHTWFLWDWKKMLGLAIFKRKIHLYLFGGELTGFLHGRKWAEYTPNRNETTHPKLKKRPKKPHKAVQDGQSIKSMHFVWCFCFNYPFFLFERHGSLQDLVNFGVFGIICGRHFWDGGFQEVFIFTQKKWRKMSDVWLVTCRLVGVNSWRIRFHKRVETGWNHLT